MYIELGLCWKSFVITITCMRKLMHRDGQWLAYSLNKLMHRDSQWQVVSRETTSKTPTFRITGLTQFPLQNVASLKFVFQLDELDTLFFLRLIYSFSLRERENACESGEGQREWWQSQADFPLSMEPLAGLDLTTLRSWTVLKSRVCRFTDWAT